MLRGQGECSLVLTCLCYFRPWVQSRLTFIICQPGPEFFQSQSGGTCPGGCFSFTRDLYSRRGGCRGPKPPGAAGSILRLSSGGWTLLARKGKPPGPKQQRWRVGRPSSLTCKAASLWERVGILARYETRGAKWSARLPLGVADSLWGQ